MQAYCKQHWITIYILKYPEYKHFNNKIVLSTDLSVLSEIFRHKQYIWMAYFHPVTNNSSTHRYLEIFPKACKGAYKCISIHQLTHPHTLLRHKYYITKRYSEKKAARKVRKVFFLMVTDGDE